MAYIRHSKHQYSLLWTSMDWCRNNISPPFLKWSNFCQTFVECNSHQMSFDLSGTNSPGWSTCKASPPHVLPLVFIKCCKVTRSPRSFLVHNLEAPFILRTCYIILCKTWGESQSQESNITFPSWIPGDDSQYDSTLNALDILIFARTLVQGLFCSIYTELCASHNFDNHVSQDMTLSTEQITKSQHRL